MIDCMRRLVFQSPLGITSTGRHNGPRRRPPGPLESPGARFKVVAPEMIRPQSCSYLGAALGPPDPSCWMIDWPRRSIVISAVAALFLHLALAPARELYPVPRCLGRANKVSIPRPPVD